MRSLTTFRLTTLRAPVASRTILCPLSTTSSMRSYKDDQDRTTVAPRAHDGTSSSSDEDVAHNDHAFDRTNTDPKISKDQHPEDLEVSGANQEVNKPQGDNPSSDKGATRSGRTSKSGHGGGGKTKAGKPN